MERPVFVGRDEDLRFLQEAWHDVEHGKPRFVVLIGDRGIGKTRLVHEFYAWLSRNQPLVDDRSYWPA